MNERPKFEPDCFFKKAIRLYPKQGETYKVWAMHLHRSEKYQEAVDALKMAMKNGDTGPDVHYQLGMSYLSLGNEAAAKKHARKAYATNYPLQGLKNRLGHKLQQD